MRMFVYGTLMDRDVIAIVLGRSLDGVSLTPACVGNMARVRAAGHLFPILVHRIGRTVQGQILDGLSPIDRARMAFYETEKYGVRILSAETDEDLIEVETFLPTDLLLPTHEIWDLASWQRHDKAAALIDIADQMAACPIAPASLGEGAALHLPAAAAAAPER